MSKLNVLIVPGYKGSGVAHWQTWIENHTMSRRVEQDWGSPILARWADNVRDSIDSSVGALWIVAHSFGCLAAISAAIDRPDRIAGLMLVAPADPERFTLTGIRDKSDWNPTESIRALIPVHKLPFPSLVVASDDDPWMKLTTIQLWSECWGSRLLILNSAGHINIASGYGPWPLGLSLLKEFQSVYQDLPLGDVYIEDFSGVTRGRGGQIARTRHQTRRSLGL